MSIQVTDAYSIVTDGIYEEPFLLYVGVGGDVNVIMDDGNEVLFKNVRSGTFMPVFVKSVRSFGTSASGFLATKTSDYTDNSFKITVDTTQAGSASDTFILPLASGETYNFDIAWGDGTSETVTSDTDVTHVYSTGGTYQISITGQIPRVYFNNSGDKAKLMSIDNFGTYAQGSTSQAFAFKGCSNMVINATDVGYFGSVTNFYQSFENCSSLTSFPLIDTSSGGNFFATWRFCSGLTSFPLIDTSSATFLSNTWANCSSLTSFPQIDTSSGTTFKEAWFNCTSLTTLDVSNWNVSSVTNMDGMFYNCTSLTNIDVSSWDVSSVTNMVNMFQSCTSLTTLDVSNWDVSSVTNMDGMFYNCTSLTTLDVSNWDVSSVLNMIYMFYNCPSLTNIDVSNWDVSSVLNMIYMFYNCPSLTNIDVSNWNVSSVTNMVSMFRDCDNFDNDLSLWDITSVTNFTGFMQFATGLSTVNYDATLIGWEATLQAAYPSGVGYTPTISIDFGGSQYTSGGAAETARQSLITNFNWTIVDGGSI